MTAPAQLLADPTVYRVPGTAQIRALFRDRAGEWIYTSESRDDGRRWQPKQVATRLPNNQAVVSAVQLASGALLVAFNNAQGSDRFPLSLALSEDGGSTWPWVRDGELGGAYDGPDAPRGRHRAVHAARHDADA